MVYRGPFYAIEEANNLCPKCTASGATAEKFDGEFQDRESVDEMSDPAELDELVRRTPGYRGCQQEYWRGHCDDFCAFLRAVGYAELKALGVLEEVMGDLEDRQREGSGIWRRSGMSKGICSDASAAGGICCKSTMIELLLIGRPLGLAADCFFRKFAVAPR